MVKSSSKVKSDRVAFKYVMPPVQALTKRKSERIEKLRKQAFERDEKLDKEEAAFFDGLKKKSVTSAEVEKLRLAGISSCEALLTYCNKSPKISGLTELRLHEICRSALEAGKVRGVNRLLKETAFAKKQHFVVVRDLPKGVTEHELKMRFNMISGFKRVELRKGTNYGFVYYISRDDAQRAARVMNGEVINFQAILVKLDGEPRGLFPYCS